MTVLLYWMFVCRQMFTSPSNSPFSSLIRTRLHNSFERTSQETIMDARSSKPRQQQLNQLNKHGTDIHHVCQLVQHLVDLLAVREADVGLSHQTSHFLPDVVCGQLNKYYKGKNKQQLKELNRKLSGWFNGFVIGITNRAPYFHHEHVGYHVVQQSGQESVLVILQALPVMISQRHVSVVTNNTQEGESRVQGRCRDHTH